jgi:hypothetical protein
VLNAGVAIVAFSLFIYSITFKNWEKVTYSFTLLLFCVMLIFGADAFVTVISSADTLNLILKIHWLGLIFLPTTYFLFSDALLTMTGKPSRGKRRWIGYTVLIVSLIFTGFLLANRMIGKIVVDQSPAVFTERTIINDFFSIFFVATLSASWWNFIRAYRRTVTTASQRRMLYLIISSLGPAVGSFPFLIYGSQFAILHPMVFWLVSFLANALVYLTLIAMAYAVSFFGFPWPDRVIKSRLFRWVMRGPITASLTLAVTTLITRLGEQHQANVSAAVVLAMIAVIVLFEYFITLFAPIWEKLFFYGKDRADLEKIRMLEDRLLTSNDIRQFLELTLATFCDRLQISDAVLLVHPAISENLEVTAGNGKFADGVKEKVFSQLEVMDSPKLFEKIENVTAIAITQPEDSDRIMLGAFLISEYPPEKLDSEKKTALTRIISRLTLALKDRKSQEELFLNLEMLAPKVSVIQNLLAYSRRDQTYLMNGEDQMIELKDLEKWTKDALTQMWGGPKISRNPIMQLSIVQMRIRENHETPINAVRAILREAINQLKPDGERLYTNEWILFNLLDLKYFEGWKVTEIARKLALSEADLYRKQRIAINAVSRNLIELEKNHVLK